MDYQETIDYLYIQHPVFMHIGAGAYKPGLMTAITLAEAFGNPHRAFKSIHIAGTNGKGSTSHMIASILAEAGYKVGLYTSPHIFDFRERIRVNGEKITENAVVDFVERYRKLGLECEPSFFELTTIMAFDYFKSQGVEIAVIETGLGGRLDTTNIIMPLLSIITNVSLDHMALLGNDEKSIAFEKAGIIKSSVPVLVGECQDAIKDVFDSTAAQLGSEIRYAEASPYPIIKNDDGSFSFSVVRNSTAEMSNCDLTGDFQAKNINTVLNAMDVLRIADSEAIKRGLRNVRDNTSLFGRWTPVNYKGHNLIVDTGHNIGAWRHLAPRLSAIADDHQLRLILGFSNDKDIRPIFQLLPHNAKYYLVKPSVARGRDPHELLSMAQSHGLDAQVFDSVTAGFNTAINDSGTDDTIFIGGSNFVVADLTQDILA